jgi:predicted nucleotidyltransferase
VLSEADIDRIVRRVVTRMSPLAVGLFGSYATGAARPASDLDLVVFTDAPAAGGDPRRAVLGALRGIFHPVDAHVFVPERFEAEALERLSFAWVIVRQFRLCYAAPGALERLPSLAQRAASGASLVRGADPC